MYWYTTKLIFLVSRLERLDLFAGQWLCTLSRLRSENAIRARAPRYSSGVLEESEVPYLFDDPVVCHH